MDTRLAISIGHEVVTSDGQLLGWVKQVGSGTFEVERGTFFRRDFSISYQDVARASRNVVVLALSTSELAEAREHGGLGITVRERAAGVVDHVRGALDRALHPAHAPTSERG